MTLSLDWQSENTGTVYMIIENFCNFRNPPGFAFLVYKYGEDAEEAVKKLHGK